MPRHRLAFATFALLIASIAWGEETLAPVTDAGVVVASFTDAATEPPIAEIVEVSTQDIEKEQAAAQLAGLSETAKPECEARLTKALGWLQSAEDDSKRRAAFELQAKAIPETVAKLEAMLATAPPATEVQLPGDATVVQLESRLTEIRQQTEALETDFNANKKEAETRTARSQEISKELIELQKRLPQAQGELAANPPADFESRSKWFEQAARLGALHQQIERLRAERRYLEAASELLPLKRDQAEREWKARQKLLAAWQTAVESWRKKESQRQADTARRNAENSHPAFRALADQNAAIAEERTVTASGIEKIRKTTKRLRETSKILESEFEDLRQKVAYAGATSSTGVLLRKKRGELPSSEEFSKRDAMVKLEMPRAHLQLMEWKKLTRGLSDPTEAAERLLAQLDALVQKYGREQVLQVATALLSARRDLLDKAIPDQETYLQELNDLDLSNQALRTEVDDFRDYLDQRVLWMRSNELLRTENLRQAARGVIAMVRPSHWAEVARVGFGDLVLQPSIGLGVLALFVLIIVFRARMLSLQRRLGQPPLEGEPASFVHYATAFAITVLIAVRWPIVLFAIGCRLKLASGTTAWTQSVGNACLATVVFVWGCELLREVARSEGIGEKLFRWPTSATKSIRSTVKLTLLFGTPLVALLQLSQFDKSAGLESLHRVVFIGTISLFVIQIGMILRPNGRLMRSLAEQSPGAAVYRLRHLIWIGTTAAPAGFALLSVLGFHYSAYQLSGRLSETGAAIVGIIFVYSLALCWLEVNGYNRVLRERGDVEGKDEANTFPAMPPVADANMSIQQESIDPISLREAADHEFRSLLRYAAIGAMTFGGWFIWADVLPALHVLDRVELWQNIETFAETVTGSDGRTSIVMTDHAVPTTLTDVLKAILICVGTIMIGRRLPGFLELTVLERLPIDQGGRQATAILVRYAATLAGLLLACHIIRVSWGSVQWLAAAMTVGLGFGLQEIFANLVSGIIILFERPIRLGDVVTVNDVTGNVSKMQMRATTITDFDRRELIVPNKKFITDNVINWTLSDPVSRVVLPVGVAYGTKIKKVENILMRIARESSYVMKEPGPSTLFKGFGDSTLDMELRVFIPTRDFYIDVVNELNTAIATEFETAGIEIAFPQQDLHIKSISTLEALMPVGNRKEAA